MPIWRDRKSRAVRPYIGIVGISSRNEAGEAGGIIQSIFTNEVTRSLTHVPQIGVQVSTETLFGLPKGLNPHLDELRLIFDTVLLGTWVPTFNVVHFNSRLRPPELIDAVMHRLCSHDCLVSDNLLHGIQFNRLFGVIPVAEFVRLKERHPQLAIILQIHSDALCLEDADIASRAEEYSSVVDYFLLDSSGGMGVPMDLARMTRLGSALVGRTGRALLGFAGGISGANAHENIAALKSALGTSNFCIDAQSRLKDLRGRWSAERSRTYLQNAVVALT